jgi:hypothetical protein
VLLAEVDRWSYTDPMSYRYGTKIEEFKASPMVIQNFGPHSAVIIEAWGRRDPSMFSFLPVKI